MHHIPVCLSEMAMPLVRVLHPREDCLTKVYQPKLHGHEKPLRSSQSSTAPEKQFDQTVKKTLGFEVHWRDQPCMKRDLNN
jgi:hypothetical protein